MFLTHFVPMKTPKCYTWLESCGSHLSGGIKEKIFFSILQSVQFSRTLRTDIFLYTEKLSSLIGLTRVGQLYKGICLILTFSFTFSSLFYVTYSVCSLGMDVAIRAFLNALYSDIILCIVCPAIVMSSSAGI